MTPAKPSRCPLCGAPAVTVYTPDAGGTYAARRECPPCRLVWDPACEAALAGTFGGSARPAPPEFADPIFLGM